MRVFWKCLAIFELIILFIGCILLYLYIAYKTNQINNIKDILSTIMCAMMLFAFIFGSTGWFIILEFVCEKKGWG